MNNEEQLELIKSFEYDFALRVFNTLFIKNNEGKIVPFKMNRVQQYVHDIAEEQKKEDGMVRLVVLKGRKQGISTYVAARFFDNIMRNSGISSFILAHLKSSTGALCDIVDTFYNNYPNFKVMGENDFIINKRVKTSDNAAELSFDNQSGYSVGTAGAGEIGRGFTIQLLHLSEAAFYEHGDKISAGIMTAVPNAKNTEIIMESTANGIGNLFHETVMKARLGKGSYRLVFIPWFWEEAYRRKVPNDFTLTEEEAKYKFLYQLDDEQINWRRYTIYDSKGGLEQFRREYPATVEEAFDVSIEGSYYDIEDIDDAINAPIPPGKHKVLCGLDIGGAGEKADRIIFSLRAGRHHLKTITYQGLKSEEIILKAKQIIRAFKVSVMFVDKGFNPAVCEFLERDFPSKIIGVFFGGKADEPLTFLNKRAEMATRLKKWLKDKPVKLTIEANSTLKQEMLAMKKKVKLDDPSAKIQMISKEEIKELLGISTDELDALMLTFAYYVEDYDDFDFDEIEEENESTSFNGCRITGY